MLKMAEGGEPEVGGPSGKVTLKSRVNTCPATRLMR